MWLTITQRGGTLQPVFGPLLGTRFKVSGNGRPKAGESPDIQLPPLGHLRTEEGRSANSAWRMGRGTTPSAVLVYTTGYVLLTGILYLVLGNWACIVLGILLIHLIFKSRRRLVPAPFSLAVKFANGFILFRFNEKWALSEAFGLTYRELTSCRGDARHITFSGPSIEFKIERGQKSSEPGDPATSELWVIEQLAADDRLALALQTNAVAETAHVVKSAVVPGPKVQSGPQAPGTGGSYPSRAMDYVVVAGSMVVCGLMIAGLVFAIVSGPSPAPDRAPPGGQPADPNRFTYSNPPLVDTVSLARSLVRRRVQSAGLELTPVEHETLDYRLMANKTEPIPESGLLRKHFVGEGTAPLEVVASDGQNHFVKLVDTSTQKDVVAAFVRAGESIEIDVPPGSFELRSATGSSWFGPVLDFGLTGTHLRYPRLLMFTEDGDGHTVTLRKTVRGRFASSPIDPTSF